jgi:hypothetical protein
VFLPVLDDGQIAGVVSLGDLARGEDQGSALYVSASVGPLTV